MFKLQISKKFYCSLKKKSMYKWIQVAQACVIQGPTVLWNQQNPHTGIISAKIHRGSNSIIPPVNLYIWFVQKMNGLKRLTIMLL